MGLLDNCRGNSIYLLYSVPIGVSAELCLLHDSGCSNTIDYIRDKIIRDNNCGKI